NPLVADALKRVYRRSTDFPVEYGKRLDPATVVGAAIAAPPLLGLERDVGIQPGCAQRGDENRASRRRDKYDDRRRVRRRIGCANADQHRCKAPGQQQRPHHTQHEPDGDHLRSGGEDSRQQLPALCPKRGAYGELACPLRDSARRSPRTATVIKFARAGTCRKATYISARGWLSSPYVRTSPTTPTIVSQGAGPLLPPPSMLRARTRLPIGFWPGQYVAAIFWLITATRGVPSRSCARSNARPATMGIASV